MTQLGDDLVTVLSVDEQTPNRKTHVLFTDGQQLHVPFRWLRETASRTTQQHPTLGSSWVALQHEPNATTLAQVIKQEAGGIAPHWKGAAGALAEEYQRAVPVYLRNHHGRPADEVASILRERYPHFGVETESDLYEALKYYAHPEAREAEDFHE